MDYEKKYDDALQRARELHEAGNVLTKTQMEIVFHELRESENERIRKEIIHYILYDAKGVSEEQEHAWISYLEKQKEKPADAKSERVIKAARRVLNNWLYGDVSADVSGDFTELEYSIRKYDGEEKQKEQKPVEHWQHVGEVDLEKDKAIEILEDYLKWAVSESEQECSYTWNELANAIRLGIDAMKEKKPNIELIRKSWYMEGYSDRKFNREPKWIIKTGEGGPRYEENPKYGQVIDEKHAKCGCTNDESEYDKGYREGHKYGLKQTQEYMLPGGKTFSGLIPCWVNAPSELQPAHKYHGKNAVIMHENNGGFRCICIDDKKPVTFHLPEDTLFVEGWRKKSSEWSEEDETRLTNILIMLKEYVIHHYSKDDVDKSVDWLENRVKSLRPQPKQEWSDDIIRKAVKEVGLTQHQINWFETNVFPPKQEWSEEDENIMNDLISLLWILQGSTNLIQGTASKYTNWLKSLRPQSHWKPSEEQHSDDLEEAVEKQINEALYKWSYDDEDGIEQYVHDAFKAGAEWQKKNIITLIQSRLSEIIGDAQPKPALRAEVQELIEKIEKDDRR